MLSVCYKFAGVPKELTGERSGSWTQRHSAWRLQDEVATEVEEATTGAEACTEDTGATTCEARATAEAWGRRTVSHHKP